MRKQVTARLFDETEGALRYREVDSSGTPIHGDQAGAFLGDIYLRKMAVTGKPPQQIKVTIEY
jgi:hypothetical protein